MSVLYSASSMIALVSSR